jgi:hypothetical protein
MIETEDGFRLTLEQLQRMSRALGLLYDDTFPKNPRNFALLAEGPLDQIQQLVDELEQYRASLSASPPARSRGRRVG